MAGMLDLYEEAQDRGLNVAGLSGWSSWQSGYHFHRPDSTGTGSSSSPPSCFIYHHTASSAYTPNVKNSKGQSKANIWLGLARPGTSRLYSTGSGTPKAVFAVRWAANYGNGACISDVYDRYVYRDLVVPGAARTWTSKSDNSYANRRGIGMEMVHLGDGTQLHPGVFELACQLGAASEDVFNWAKNRSRLIGHEDSTRRKVDPRQSQGAPYTMEAIRNRVKLIQDGDEGGVTPPPGGDMAEGFLQMFEGDGLDAGPRPYKKGDVAWLQGELNVRPEVSPKLTTDGKWGSGTTAAMKQVFPNGSGGNITGNDWRRLVSMNRATQGGGTTPPPTGELPEHTHHGADTGGVK